MRGVMFLEKQIPLVRSKMTRGKILYYGLTVLLVCASFMNKQLSGLDI
jgi:hypothetical protein